MHSGGVQQSLAEQREGCPAIHLALERLEAVDLAFRLALAPVQQQRRLHRCKVTAYPACEAAQFGDAAVLGRHQPGVQFGHRTRTTVVALVDECAEVLYQRAGLANLRTEVQQCLEELLLGRVADEVWLHQEPAGSVRRAGAGARGSRTGQGVVRASARLEGASAQAQWTDAPPTEEAADHRGAARVPLGLERP